ncbi:MAG: hypothetical protein CMN60_21015 [Sphingobium sp.]|nr:hypothetical protein [Sphingobium sp.]MBS50113.1 hypothetical protein [Sphingobium sp.]|tara:strand:- start:273787 stop:273969 length:183 start_codon:yes stop_codon:yes gene_type:complete
MKERKFKSKQEALDTLAIELIGNGVDLEVVDAYITAAEHDANDDTDALEPTLVPGVRFVW